MKTRYCFVEYEDPRDCEDAIRKCNGMTLEGERCVTLLPSPFLTLLPCLFFLRLALNLHDFLTFFPRIICEWTYSRQNRSNNNRDAVPYKPERSPYRIKVENLPKSVGWQNLKDHFRKKDEIVYGEILGNAGSCFYFYVFSRFDFILFCSPLWFFSQQISNFYF